MGLRYGAQKLLEKLRRGVYRNDDSVQRYNIYVDGELMRYKGMVSSNMARHNACEAIATTGFDYMMSLVRHIESRMPLPATKVIVYMDGQQRVRNKVVRVHTHQFDVDMIRNIFKGKCLLNDIEIVELVEGESELQMYLQRDRLSDLNIFVTSDSDMISITYGHEPSTELAFDDLRLREGDEGNDGGRIVDLNANYVMESSSSPPVRDSCLWVNCSYHTVAIGCDYSVQRLRLHRSKFLVFVGMCGTDFTDNVLTETMIAGVLKASDHEIDYINERLLDVDVIVCALVYLGVKYGGTLKPMKRIDGGEKKADGGGFNTYISNIQQYMAYIETGVMMDRDMESVNTATMSRHDIFSDRLGYPGTSYKRSELAVWTKLHNLETLL